MATAFGGETRKVLSLEKGFSAGPDSLGLLYGSFPEWDPGGAWHGKEHRTLGYEEWKFHPASPEPYELGAGSLSVLPDGSLLISGVQDGQVRLGCLTAPLALITLSRYPEAATALSFPPDGRFLASGSEDGTLSLFDLAELDGF